MNSFKSQGSFKGELENSLPTVSIIIINYNGRYFLKNCLKSLNEISYPRDKVEIILVDNASTDGSVEYVKRNFPQVRVLRLNRNFGFTGGANRGASIARGEYLLFLNNDTIVDKNWLLELITAILTDDRIAICGSRVLSMRNHSDIGSIGFLNMVGGALLLPHHKGLEGKMYHFVGSIHGASILIKKKVFSELSGFEDDYFMYSDEVDLCHRAWLYGYYVAYCPRSIVYHYEGGTANTSKIYQRGILCSRLSSSFRIYYGNRNSMVNMIKNLEFINVVKGLIISGIYFLIQLSMLLRSSRVRDIILLLKAYAYPIRHLKSTLKKRFFIQRRRRISDHELMSNGLMLSSSSFIKLIYFLMWRSKYLK